MILIKQRYEHSSSSHAVLVFVSMPRKRGREVRAQNPGHTLKCGIENTVSSKAGFSAARASAVWELLTGKPLYPGLAAARVSHQVAYQGLRPPLPPACPAGYLRLMTACWRADAALR